MNNFQGSFNKKIILGIGLLLTFVFLILLLFVLPKKFTKEAKKAEILKEKERIEREIAEKEKEKENIEAKVTEILTQTMAKEDGQVKGVEIIKRDDKKLIRNRGQGYEIEIPAKMLLAQSITSDELKFFVSDQESNICCPGYRGCPSDLTILIEENPKKISLEEWVRNNKKEVYLDTTAEIEASFKELGWQKIKEDNWYKTEVFIERFIQVPTLEYFLAKDDKIYTITITEWESPYQEDCSQKIPYQEVEKILETFKLI